MSAPYEYEYRKVPGKGPVLIVSGEVTADLYEALLFIFEHIADKERGPRDLYPAFGLHSRQAIEMASAALARARGEPQPAASAAPSARSAAR